jgi:pimeloyl-ACP methyl ester carboxylesterase
MMPTMLTKRFNGKNAAIICLASPMLGFAAVWLAGSFLCRPVQHPVGALPGDLPGRSVEFQSASGARIRGWLIPGRKGAGAVALMHGFRGDRTQLINRAPFLHRAGYTVLAFDFQAHGESAGELITVGYLESRDAQAAIAFLKREAPGEKIGVIGLSMGGAASILASPPLDVSAMVLELVYPDIRGATANRLERYLGRWSRGLAPLLTMQIPLRAGIDASVLRPVGHVGAIKAPKLFIAGARDRHTKLFESQQLFDAAGGPKELWVVDAAHEDVHRVAPEEYERRVLAFFGTAFNAN